MAKGNKTGKPQKDEESEDISDTETKHRENKQQVIDNITQRFIFRNDELRELGRIVNKSDVTNVPVFLGAVILGRFDLVKRLTQGKQSLDICDGDGMTPVMWAVQCGNTEMSELLIRKGASTISVNVNGDNILLLALYTHVNWNENAFIDLWNLIKIRSHIDVNCSNKKGYTMLHYAVKNNWKTVTEILLENHANVNSATVNGLTPLMIAGSWKDGFLVERLLKAGADIFQEDECRCTALCYAVAYNNKSEEYKMEVLPPYSVHHFLNKLNSEESKNVEELRNYMKRRLELLIIPENILIFQELFSNIIPAVMKCLITNIYNGLDLFMELNPFDKMAKVIMNHLSDTEYMRILLRIIFELLFYCDCCLENKISNIRKQEIMNTFFLEGAADMCIKVLQVHGHQVIPSAMFPILVAGSYEGTARKWLLENSELVQQSFPPYENLNQVIHDLNIDACHKKVLKKKLKIVYYLLEELIPREMTASGDSSEIIRKRNKCELLDMDETLRISTDIGDLHSNGKLIKVRSIFTNTCIMHNKTKSSEIANIIRNELNLLIASTRNISFHRKEGEDMSKRDEEVYSLSELPKLNYRSAVTEICNVNMSDPAKTMCMCGPSGCDYENHKNTTEHRKIKDYENGFNQNGVVKEIRATENKNYPLSTLPGSGHKPMGENIRGNNVTRHPFSLNWDDTLYCTLINMQTDKCNIKTHKAKSIEYSNLYSRLQYIFNNQHYIKEQLSFLDKHFKQVVKKYEKYWKIDHNSNYFMIQPSNKNLVNTDVYKEEKEKEEEEEEVITQLKVVLPDLENMFISDLIEQWCLFCKTLKSVSDIIYINKVICKFRKILVMLERLTDSKTKQLEYIINIKLQQESVYRTDDSITASNTYELRSCYGTVQNIIDVLKFDDQSTQAKMGKVTNMKNDDHVSEMSKFNCEIIKASRQMHCVVKLYEPSEKEYNVDLNNFLINSNSTSTEMIENKEFDEMPARPIIRRSNADLLRPPITTTAPSKRSEKNIFDVTCHMVPHSSVMQVNKQKKAKHPTCSQHLPVSRPVKPYQQLIIIPNKYQTRWEPIIVQFKLLPHFLKVRIGDGELTMKSKDCNIRFTITVGGNFNGLEFGLGHKDIPLAVKHIPNNRSTYFICEKTMRTVKSFLGMSHKYILPYKVCVLHESILYIAQPLYEYNLGEYIMYLKKDNILQNHSKRLIMQFISGLYFLHSYQIVHGNIKPSNILISTDGNIKLADFGLSTVLYQIKSPVVSSMIWWSRETLEIYEKKFIYQCTKLSDIQVSGMIIHYIVTGGCHPFGRDPAEILHNIKRGYHNLFSPFHEIYDLMFHMLASRPENRPCSKEIIRHIYFWDENKKWQFVLACSGIHPDGTKLFPQVRQFLKWLERTSKEKGLCGDWVSVIKDRFTQLKPPEFGWNGSLTGLLRYIRMTTEQHLVNNIVSTNTYLPGLFSNVFKALPTSLHRLLQNTHWANHPAFLSYFDDSSFKI